MEMPGRTFTSEKYRYGFNGMEKDDEIAGSGNNYDFGARIYDSRIGRWTSTDPLLKNYISPYNFSKNNPVIYLDPDGRDEVHFWERLGGGYTVQIVETDDDDIKLYGHELTFESLMKFSFFWVDEEWGDQFGILDNPLKLIGWTSYDLNWFASAINNSDELKTYFEEKAAEGNENAQSTLEFAQIREVEEKIEAVVALVEIVSALRTPVKSPKSVNGNAFKAVNTFDDVARYVKRNGSLPDNFITKSQAKKLGWNPKAGNLNKVAPGKSIGGDIFKNKEGLLPSKSGRVWYEADVNFSGGHRGSDRLLYSNDGLIYKTTDHYKTFTQIK